MIRAGQIQNGVRDDHGFFEVFVNKPAAERVVSLLDYHSVSEPLPELVLRRPELFSALAEHQSIVLLALASFTLILFLFPLFFFCLTHVLCTHLAIPVIV